MLGLNLTGACAATRAGIEPGYIDPAVRMQDDMYTHMNGKWLATADIPAEKWSWGSYPKLNEDIQRQLRAIIEEAVGNLHIVTDARLSDGCRDDGRRIGALYASFIDEARLERLGIAPLERELAAIAAIGNRQQLPALIAALARIGVAAPYGVDIHQDNKDARIYLADLGQDGLGLPDRDYYLKPDDARLADMLAKYERHIGTMLTMAGDQHGAVSARAIVEFEQHLAAVQWSRVEMRDPVKTYNKFDINELATLAPGHDWYAYLTATGFAGKTGQVLVTQPSYLKALGVLFEQTPLATLKAYLRWQTLHAFAPYLSKRYVQENFVFYGVVLTGATAQPPRWKRGVALVDDVLGKSLGKLYAVRYFPAARKARIEVMVGNIMAAYRASIDQLDWMTPATRQQAQAKLAKFTIKIGYPKTWRDYSGLELLRGDLVGNVMRARAFERAHEIDKLGKPIDRDDWNMSPQTLNAAYNPQLNDITFPAAILQAPLFKDEADDAFNYGAIGAVIGHEISHGFDDNGARYDGDGNLRDWWTEADYRHFASRAAMLVRQYDAYSPLPGYHVSGELTLGENIADNSGLAIAYKAYRMSLAGKPAPVIDGLTGDQRFYMSFAQLRRLKVREAEQIRRIMSDPHAPEKFRTNGPLRNQPGFYPAFDVKPGDHMYLPPEQRVNMW